MLPVKLGLVLDILLTAAAVEGSHVLHPEVIRVGPDGDGERACGCGVGVCQPHLGSPWGYGRGRGGGIEPAPQFRASDYGAILAILRICAAGSQTKSQNHAVGAERPSWP